MTPTTEPAQRIAIMFKRRLTTHWSEKEIIQYKKLVKAGYFKDMTDFELVERYYVFERRKKDKGIHRRDMDTFLNNYPGEVDRAKLWDMQFRRRVDKKRKDLGQGHRLTTDEEWKRIGDLAKQELEAFREKLKQPEYEKSQTQ